ncbi:hypothetical protein HII17_11400 [Thalassotalea sp. M1531]|uniref:LURP-one-related family protein n=1 Tax=Thalassotalea algicola TaxID=2716224 RepID=A0A7Y0LEF8_9GAMM|nr:LURP-one-related family protein [Thalassotalea algicola]NMP32176.1 hypothetical protein [Thalassotalea algicola]
MRFVMKQKIFSLRDSFEIFDENDTLAYVAKGGFVSIRKGLTLKNNSDQNVAKIRQKLIAWKPTFYIKFNNGYRCKIKKCFFPLFKSRFLITTPQAEIVIDGDFWAHEYQFSCKGEEIANVSKRWFSFSDTYGVDIKYPEDVELILSAVAVIDMVIHDDSGSISSD